MYPRLDTRAKRPTMMLIGDFSLKMGCKEGKAEITLRNHGIDVRNER